jgi:hypothetical protein
LALMLVLVQLDWLLWQACKPEQSQIKTRRSSRVFFILYVFESLIFKK